MRLVYLKPIVATLWVSAAFVIGIVERLNSFPSWAVLTAVAVVPPLVMLWLWSDSRQSMSESIQDALR